jgi:hypothetical protein
MLGTIINLLILFVATFAIIIFMAVFGFFLFIMFACVYIGWEQIKGMPIPAIWEKIKKE